MTKQPKTSKRTAGRRLGAAGGSDLYAAADTLHLSIATMLKDWRDGDFALPKLATIHMQKIEEDYRALGKALLANSPNHQSTPEEGEQT
jgi:hypothetical protein